DPAIELIVLADADRPVVRRVFKKILGIVKKVNIDAGLSHALGAHAQLRFQELWMNAVPDALAVFHHFRKLAPQGKGHVLALNVSALGDQNDAVAGISRKDFAHQSFRMAIAVVGAGVDEVAAAVEVIAQGTLVHGVAFSNAIAAKAERVASEAGGPEGTNRAI